MSNEKRNFSEPPPPYGGMPTAPISEMYPQMAHYPGAQPPPPPPQFHQPPMMSHPNPPGFNVTMYPGTAQFQTPYPNQSNPNQNVPTTVIVNMANLGPYPQSVTCPSCNANVVTLVESTPGLFTWVLCGVLALVGCFAGCCLIPCCIQSCRDAIHSCPNCRAQIGSYRRL